MVTTRGGDLLTAGRAIQSPKGVSRGRLTGITNEAPSDSRPLVLVVDDNPDHLSYLRTVLEPRYRVATASDGLAGYGLACRMAPGAILLDLSMPVMDGLAVLRKLRQNRDTAETPIIVVSGLGAGELKALSQRVDVASILQKPCHPGEILEAVQRALSTAA